SDEPLSCSLALKRPSWPAGWVLVGRPDLSRVTSAFVLLRLVTQLCLVVYVGGDRIEILGVLASMVDAEQQPATSSQEHPHVGQRTAGVAPVGRCHFWGRVLGSQCTHSPM